MIRTLRIKLILASMLSLLLVLTVIIGTATVLSYNKLPSDSDSILSVLEENNGSLPVGERQGSGAQGGAGINPGRNDRLLSPELPYESRYFLVSFAKDGTVLSVNTGNIAAVDTQTAIEYTQQVLDGTKTRGFWATTGMRRIPRATRFASSSSTAGER